MGGVRVRGGSERVRTLMQWARTGGVAADAGSTAEAAAAAPQHFDCVRACARACWRVCAVGFACGCGVSCVDVRFALVRWRARYGACGLARCTRRGCLVVGGCSSASVDGGRRCAARRRRQLCETDQQRIDSLFLWWRDDVSINEQRQSADQWKVGAIFTGIYNKHLRVQAFGKEWRATCCWAHAELARALMCERCSEYLALTDGQGGGVQQIQLVRQMAWTGVGFARWLCSERVAGGRAGGRARVLAFVLCALGRVLLRWGGRDPIAESFGPDQAGAGGRGGEVVAGVGRWAGSAFVLLMLAWRWVRRPVANGGRAA
jgi:hypothetical protein